MKVERKPVLSPGERQGLTRMYRDASDLHGVDQGLPSEGVDDVSELHWGEVSIAEKVKIKPLEFSGIVKDGRWIPECWVILVTDAAAPDTIRGQWIVVTNHELPEDRRMIPTPIDQIHTEDGIRALSETERADLVAFMRTLPHGDVLRELV